MNNNYHITLFLFFIYNTGYIIILSIISLPSITNDRFDNIELFLSIDNTTIYVLDGSNFPIIIIVTC